MINITIEIDDDATREREIRADRGSFTIREQSAWVHFPTDRYPVKITVGLERNTPAYRPGKYRLSASSFTVDRFGKLQLKRSLDLEPTTTI